VCSLLMNGTGAARACLALRRRDRKMLSVVAEVASADVVRAF